MPLTVPYKEVKVRDGQSPEYSCDQHGPAATRHLMFDWSNIEQAEIELIGRHYVEGGVLKRVLPCVHPKKPHLFVERVWGSEGKANTGYETVVFPDGGTDKSATYNKGFLRVDYSTRPYPVLKDEELPDSPAPEYNRYVEVDEHSQSSYVTGPGTKFRLAWAQGSPHAGVKADATSGKIRPFGNLTIRWHDVPEAALPVKAARQNAGKVISENLGREDVPSTYFLKGTLLYLGWRPIRKFSPYKGERLWTVEYYGLHDPGGNFDDELQPHFGHNSFFDFRADPIRRYQATRDGKYYEYGSIPDGKCTYDEFDPSVLFTVPS